MVTKCHSLFPKSIELAFVLCNLTLILVPYIATVGIISVGNSSFACPMTNLSAQVPGASTSNTFTSLLPIIPTDKLLFNLAEALDDVSTKSSHFSSLWFHKLSNHSFVDWSLNVLYEYLSFLKR